LGGVLTHNISESDSFAGLEVIVTNKCPKFLYSQRNFLAYRQCHWLSRFSRTRLL